MGGHTGQGCYVAWQTERPRRQGVQG